MTAAAAVTDSTLQYNDGQVGLSSRNDANRRLTRYAFSIGDHIPAPDKEGFKSIGGYFGGLWVGHSETEGVPTMRRTNYMLYRGAITPLETTAIPRKADHKDLNRGAEGYLTGEGVPPNVRGYEVFAGDGMNYLLSDRFAPMGVVEIKALQYRSWVDSNVRQIQLLLFPQWNEWLRGAKAPVLLDDWYGEISRAFERHPELRIFGEDIAESRRKFQEFALRHIEFNRQAIMSKRTVDSGGMFIGWSATSRLYASQLNVVLENEDQIRPTNQMMSTGDQSLIEEMRRDRELRTAENQTTQTLLKMMGDLLKDKGVSVERYAEEFGPTPPTGSIEAPPLVTEDVIDPLKPHVSFGANEPVGVTVPPPKVIDPKKNKRRTKLEEKMDDPNFADAVETDEGLRGAIKEDAELKGVIEDED